MKSPSIPIRRFLKWLGNLTWRPSYSTRKAEINGHRRSKVKRWREYDVLDPRDADEHVGHDCVWTRAPGIWSCRDCHEWYRTWEDAPRRDARQGEERGMI